MEKHPNGGSELRPKPKKKGWFSHHRGFQYFLVTFGVCIVFMAAVFIALNVMLAGSGGASSSSAQPVSAASAAAPVSSAVSDKDTFNLFLSVVDDASKKPVEMAVVRLDQANNRIAFIIVPLELMVSSSNQVTGLADDFAAQGQQAAVAAFTKVSLIPINYTTTIYTSHFPTVVDDLGGVDFNVSIGVNYVNSNNTVTTVPQGQQHLDGVHALALLQYTGYAGGSMQRYKVQGDFLSAFLKAKLSSGNLSNANVVFSDVFAQMQSTFALKDLTNRSDTFQSIMAGANSITTPQWNIVPVVNGQTSLFRYDAQTSQVFYTYFNAK